MIGRREMEKTRKEEDMPRHIERFAGASTAIALLAAAIAPMAQASADEARLGIPTAQTGPLGADFNEVKRPIDFAVDEANAKGGIGGRTVVAKFADTESKPNAARKAAEKLALEGYNLLTGTISSGEGLALAPHIERWNAIYVVAFSKSARLSGDSRQPRMFRVNQADASDALALKAWLKSRTEKKWAMMASDNAWGHDIAEAFSASAGETGLSVTSTQFTPMGANDFAPYIHQVKDTSPQALYAAYAARDAITFIQQAKQFGLFENIVVAGNSLNYDQTIKAIGAPLEGVWGGVDYSPAIDTPENTAFVAAWKQKYNGDAPTDFEGQAYMGAHTILQAVEQSGSSDPAAVAKAMSGGSFDTPFGKTTIRAEDRQMLLPNSFGQVRSVDGRLQNVVELTLPAEVATPPVNAECKLAQK
jgi:branched-chain amino acid transport system substrate-binding protein